MNVGIKKIENCTGEIEIHKPRFRNDWRQIFVPKPLFFLFFFFVRLSLHAHTPIQSQTFYSLTRVHFSRINFINGDAWYIHLSHSLWLEHIHTYIQTPVQHTRISEYLCIRKHLRWLEWNHTYTDRRIHTRAHTCTHSFIHRTAIAMRCELCVRVSERDGGREQRIHRKIDRKGIECCVCFFFTLGNVCIECWETRIRKVRARCERQ